MTPARALEYARRIAARTASLYRSDPLAFSEETIDYVARHVVPIVYEAVTEAVEDHLVSVMVVKGERET